MRRRKKEISQLKYDAAVFEYLKKLEFELVRKYFGYNIYRSDNIVPTDLNGVKLFSQVFAVSKGGLDDLEGYCFFRVDPSKETKNDVLYDFMIHPGIKESILENAEFYRWLSLELVQGKALRKLNQLDYSQIVRPGNPQTLRISDLLQETE
jgi:hypothetical protein